MNRNSFLRIYGISIERWAMRHDLELYTRPCSRCGALLETSIPFATGTFRGLVAPACECGNENTPYVLVRADGHGDLFTEELSPIQSRPRMRRKPHGKICDRNRLSKTFALSASLQVECANDIGGSDRRR